MINPNNPCIFCKVDKKNIIYENDYAYVSYDSYPVSKFHSLIIPKRHISDFFDLNKDELFACNDVIHKIKKEIEKKDKLVKGFNIGTNAGLISGQTIMHCHIHLIPRRKGDVDNPQGGVRAVIPLKQHYLRKSK
tara:strand:+ start:403 stop:804 length:402 start_codon:yes stop_codon:yes gene_type:complete